MSANTPVVRCFHHADSGTWSYLVADAETAQALIIDPVLDYQPNSGRTSTTSVQCIVDAAMSPNYHVAWILETHAHADHLSAAAWLKTRLGAPVAISENICDVQRTFKPIFNLEQDFATDGSQFDHLFRDGETFFLGGIAGKVIAAPGHTSDSVCYLIGDALFTGDSLFMPDSGTARCDFPGGDAATLHRSIQRLYTLPDTTRVFVGHDYAPGGRDVCCKTSIGEQKSSNIHLRSDTSAADFIAIRQARDTTLAIPTLLLPAVQVNLRAGQWPPPEENGVRYLKIPLDTL